MWDYNSGALKLNGRQHGTDCVYSYFSFGSHLRISLYSTEIPHSVTILDCSLPRLYKIYSQFCIKREALSWFIKKAEVATGTLLLLFINPAINFMAQLLNSH